MMVLAGAPLLAHVGPLAAHDLIVVIPMAVLSALLLVVMARPRRRPADPDHQPPDSDPNRVPNRGRDPDPDRKPGPPGPAGPPDRPYSGG